MHALKEWSHVYLGVVTISLVVLLCMIGVSCLLAVLYFHWRVLRGRRLGALRELDAPWGLRALLSVFSVFWGMGELLRLPLLRRLGWPLHKLDPVSQAYLCGLHVIASIGLWEPSFFLAALALVRWSLRDPPYESSSAPNTRRLGAATLPFLALQVVIIASSLVMGEGFGARIPPYFTTYSFDSSSAYFDFDPDIGGVSYSPDRHTTLCTYPLLSAISFVAFAIIFSIVFLIFGLEIITFSINKKLRRRVSRLVLIVVTCLPLSSMFIGFSSIIVPSEPTHEALSFLAFITLLVCIMAGQGVLVLHPIMASLAIGWNSQRPREIWSTLSSFNTNSLYISTHSLPSNITTEEDESPHELERKNLLDTNDLLSV